MREFTAYNRDNKTTDRCPSIPRDRDAKQRWATNMAASGWGMGIGGIGGQLLSGAVRNSVGRVFGA